MGFAIEDGTGKGYQVLVDSSNRLHVYSISESLEHHTNIIHGEAYNLLFAQTPTAAGDCFLYMKNENDLDIIFEGITLNVPTDETVQIKLGDAGTPVGGAAVEPTNLNAGSNNNAQGDFQAGNDITGLSGGTVAAQYFLNAGGSSAHFNFEQDIILPKNRILTLYVVTGAILVTGYLAFFYHERV